MKTRTFGFLIMMTLLLAVGSSQTDRSVRLAFLPYGDCATCFSLHLTRETVHLYTLLNVTPDGQRLYLIDMGGVLHVLSRTGEHLRSVREFAVPSSTIQAIAPDGSMVALDSSMLIEVHAESHEADQEVHAESHEADQPEAYRTESRRFWILKPDGTIDWERSDKFYQALDNLLDFIVEKYGKANPLCDWVFFYTGDRLGCGLRSLATQTDEGTYELVHPSGLIILKQDGGFERIIYDGAIAASKQGAILQDPAKGEEAQKELLVRRSAAGDSNLVYTAEYRILREDGTITRGVDPALEPVPRRVRLISPDGKQSKEIVLRQDLMGTLLDDFDHKLDGRGRLYCAGSLPEQRIHTLWIAGQEKGLALLDGPIVVRFREDGQYDGVVAQLKLPADIQSRLPWDVDNAGNLYYLHFTAEGVEVRMIPSK